MRSHGHRFSLVAASVAAALLLAGPVSAAKPPSGGGWTAGSAISPAGQPDPTRGAQVNDLAVNASGVALAAWDQYTYAGSGGSTIGAAIETSGRWSAPVTLSAAGGFATTPRVAVAPDGSLAVSWSWQDPIAATDPLQKVQVAVRRAGAPSWTTTTLATSPIGGVQGISQGIPIAFDGAGNLTAAWIARPAQIQLIETATLSPAGAWSAVTDLEPGFDALFPAVAANAAGTTAIAWSTSPYSAATTSSVHLATRAAGGTWSAPRVVSEVLARSLGALTGPMVGLDRAGLATVAWFGAGIEATRQIDATTWSTPRSVMPAPTAVSSFGSPDMATDDLGNAVIVASIFDATIGVDRSSVVVTRGNAAGTWTAPLRITDPAIPVDAYASRVARSPDGRLTLVSWVDHYHGVAQSARLDDASGVWSTTTIGKGSAFSSFQEVMGLDAASATTARVIWKVSRGSTFTDAADYRP